MKPLISVLLIAILAGCSDVEKPRPDVGLRVAASIPPHAYLIKQIGGDRVDVITALRPGESAETFQPSERDISRLMQVDIYFRTGVELEIAPWFRALSTLNGGPEMLDLRSSEEECEGDHHGHEHHHHGHADEPPCYSLPNSKTCIANCRQC